MVDADSKSEVWLNRFREIMRLLRFGSQAKKRALIPHVMGYADSPSCLLKAMA